MTEPGNSESQPAAEAGPQRPRQIFYVRLDPPQPLVGPHLSSPGPATATTQLDSSQAEQSRTAATPAAQARPLEPSTESTPDAAPPPASSQAPSHAAEPGVAQTVGADPAAAAMPDVVERMRRQARELAGHLRARRQAVHRRRQELDEQFARDQAELARRIAAIQQREDALDQQQEFLDQLKAEATAQHQEALETRLASEQLWAKMAERADMPEVLERIAELKRRLADQHRNTLNVISRQQEALRRSAEQLDRRQAELRKQRDELQAWVLRRHEELEQQRLQLLAREQELDAQERARQEIHSRVEEEILGYQRQIRQLSAQLRCKQELGRLRDSA